MPDRDLCADLRQCRDDELLDSENVCSASNRQLRLYVVGWMLHDDVSAAHQLYITCGNPRLLDAPGRLTTQSIAAEAIRLLADPAEQWER